MINKDIKIKDLIIDKITIDSFGFQLSIGEKEGLLSNKDDEEIIKEKISPIVIKMEDGVEIKSEYSYSSNISTKEDSKYNKTIVDGEFDSSIDFKRKKVLKLIPIKEDIIVENKLEDFNNISERTLYIWNKLNRDERALLYGRIMEELSYEELSKIHNISEETLRKRYQRAKEKFLKYNEKY